jgi:hypothetical protein
MSTVNVILQGGNPATPDISTILAAGNDVQVRDADGRKCNASRIMLSAGTDGTVNCRSIDDDVLHTEKFVSEGWHENVAISFISHTSTDASLGILLRR